MAPTDYTDFDPNGKDRKTIEPCVITRTKIYTDLYDDDLWFTFKDDFGDWTTDNLCKATVPVLGKLRDVLRTNGIYVPKGGHAGRVLANTLTLPEPHEWTKSEVVEHIQLKGTFNSPFIQLKFAATIKRINDAANVTIQNNAQFVQEDTPSPPSTNLHGMVTRMRASAGGLQDMIPHAETAPPTPTPPAPQAPLVQVATPTQTATWQGTGYVPAIRDQERMYSQVGQFAPLYVNSIAQLRKVYTTDSTKYGDNEDSFDLAHNIFLDLCRQMGLHTAEARNQAFSVMLKGLALDYYYTWKDQWERMGIDPAVAVKNHFENDEHLRKVQTDWDAINLYTVIVKYPEKSTTECLEMMFRDIQKLYHKLRPELRNEVIWHAKLISATRTHPACHAATGNPASTIPGLMQSLRGSVSQFEDTKRAAQQHFAGTYNTDPYDVPRTNMTERRFFNNNLRYQPQNRSRFTRKPSRHFRGPRNDKKTCYICKKPGHLSYNHSDEEREAHKREWNKNRSGSYQQFMAEIEGWEYDPESIEELASSGAYFEDDSSDDEPPRTKDSITSKDSANKNAPLQTTSTHFASAFFTTDEKPKGELGKLITTELANRATMHCVKALATKEAQDGDNIENDVEETIDTSTYVSASRYSEETWRGILIDTGAADFSTAGYSQFLAYRKAVKGAVMDTSTVNSVGIKFGSGDPVRSKGSVDVDTPIGRVRFHILETMTPFLLSIKDLDRLNVYYDNTKDLLIGPKENMTTQVIRRFGHPFLIWQETYELCLMESLDENPCFLTETELRRLHRRFGHPSTDRFYRVIERAGHDADREAIEHIRKFCHHCQIHGKSPGRFRFTLQDDIHFNHSIIVDIMYIDGKPVLHIIDEATRFNAARWLPNISSSATWDALRAAWIDTYLGPPDLIATDAGKNFVSKEFSQLATSIGTTVKSVPIEAHWSIGMVERYHAVLRRAYTIISDELPDLHPDMALQMAVKSVNDTAGPNGLVPTLLVFGAYPRLTQNDAPAISVEQRATALKKATAEVRKLYAQRQVRDALNTRNGPSTIVIHSLPLNSNVLVFREGNTGYAGKWEGPYKLLEVNNETCTVALPSGPTQFRSTVVKPYYAEDMPPEDIATTLDHDNAPEPPTQGNALLPPSTVKIPSQRPQRNRQPSARYRDDDFEAYINNKEITQPRADFDEVLEQTRFTDSRKQEVDGLLERGVFHFVHENEVPKGERIFNSRFVDEMKNSGTDKAFEKSRLVVQAYNDEGKDFILTESPTIQRCSQRLILCLTACMVTHSLWLRDVVQAYIQSQTYLNRDIFVRPPLELAILLSPGTLLKVVKPLYGIPESGNHWFNTYHSHHTEKLQMETSTYDPCLLHCTNSSNGFGVVGMQTDDTLILADEAFANREEKEIKAARIQCKPRERLSPTNPLKFNGGLISETAQGILLNQERTCRLIQIVQEQHANTTSSRGKIRKNVSPKEQYVSQRALGAYIASLTQPEAAFDYAFAAQSTDPQKEDIKLLNRRLQWQIDNPSRGLKFVKLDINSIKLYAFVDAAFANNKDLSSQIGFVIVLADASNNANIVHWSSVKCKRITRSVLASELYAMVNGFDFAASIKATITQILHLENPLPLVICTDSKSLYDCLVKLGTTQEKRLMIDLMCLRQSYERQEITEVKWIDGNSNPADAMTKNKACNALQILVDTNKLHITVDGWVERSTTTPQNRAIKANSVAFANPQ
ncbi:conserved hypothetical protein [Talaromyces stipitatus ATCC 10500]|uniref:Integrase catalytic domain-containing protein n=1 Tax=Talaromyces stipitatus (strain ATCC 10500 / CBS 375.48 / QM 6759 / NRRL 1006) TaxID=441959 RepID=B8MLE9_TALSN|nr:uncharacterized protein TSTA_049210 [Talaromyces stipitatus ATCC 10500]EED15482.1 conserved hypothetical protein [Talaromyces stipitatus ATCC 10500]